MPKKQWKTPADLAKVFEPYLDPHVRAMLASELRVFALRLDVSNALSSVASGLAKALDSEDRPLNNTAHRLPQAGRRIGATKGE